MRPDPRSERGTSLIEILVAILILGLGLGAAISAFAVPERGTKVSERQLSATTIAERELERIIGRPWQNIATTTVPVHQNDANTTNPSDPRFYVTGTKFAIKRNYAQAGDGDLVGGGGESLVAADPANGVPASETTAAAAPGAGDPAGTVYRFVTFRNETCPILLPRDILRVPLQRIATLTGALTNLVDGLLGGALNGGVNVMCGARNDAKRVTVAVKLNAAAQGAGPAKPVYVSAIVPNPGAGVLAGNGAQAFNRTCTYVTGLPVCS
jgi:type II secretory pathway pseudopilin PulG